MREVVVLRLRISLWIRSFLLIIFVGTALELMATDAEARAGRGRSSGRSSGFSSRQSPPPQQRQAAQSQNGNPNMAANTPVTGNPGGFMRGMAGGLAGGFLGSMLFSSLGHAAGGSAAGGGGGGIGLLEILLFAGFAYVAFRWWKNRQQAAIAFGGLTRRYGAPNLMPQTPNRGDGIDMSQFQSLSPSGIDADTALDLFFKVQGAWTRRDLSPVRSILGREILEEFEQHLSELRQSQRINRLENISLRRTDVTQRWEEGGDEYATVRFTANLLDYTVDEATGQVVDGSDSSPVKFEEDWTFAKLARGGGWQLVGIQQL